MNTLLQSSANGNQPSSPATTLRTLIASFSSSLTISSKKAYKCDLESFAAEMESIGKYRLVDVGHDDLDKYVAKMRVVYKPSSVHRKISVLRRFYHWVYGDENFRVWQRILDRHESELSMDNSSGFNSSAIVKGSVHEMLKYRRLVSRFILEMQEASFYGRYHDKMPEIAFAALYWECGVSFNDILRLKISSCELIGKHLGIWVRDRKIYMAWEWIRLISEYIAERNKGGGTYLFLSDEMSNGSGVSRARRWMEAIIDKYCGDDCISSGLGVREIGMVRRFERGKWVMPLRAKLIENAKRIDGDKNGEMSQFAAVATIAFSGYPEMALRSSRWEIEERNDHGREQDVFIGRFWDRSGEVETRAYIPKAWFVGASVQGIREALERRVWTSSLLKRLLPRKLFGGNR